MKNKRKLQHVLVEPAEEGMHRIKSCKIPNKQQERKTKGKGRGVDDSEQRNPTQLLKAMMAWRDSDTKYMYSIC